jgi:glutamyl-tRNA reductase
MTYCVQKPPAAAKAQEFGRIPMAKVAFLGLGVMGYPMAGHLKAKGGHEVTVYNRTAAKAEKWVAQFGAEGRRSRPGLRHVLRRQ